MYTHSNPWFYNVAERLTGGMYVKSLILYVSYGLHCDINLSTFINAYFSHNNVISDVDLGHFIAFKLESS